VTKNGDLVFAVNGLALTSDQRAREIYAKLKTGSEIAFEIERGGRRDRIVIYIQ
jgi:type II secretory pathway component PulC